MSIKKINPDAKFKIVYELDDALETETVQELDTGEKAADGSPVLKQSRYEKYFNSLDIADLKFKEGMTPTVFIVRALKNFETAELNEKYISIDPATKRLTNKSPNKMYLEMFNTACLGEEKTDGTIVKILPDEIGFAVATNIGVMISLIGILGKNQKKQ